MKAVSDAVSVGTSSAVLTAVPPGVAVTVCACTALPAVICPVDYIHLCVPIGCLHTDETESSRQRMRQRSSQPVLQPMALVAVHLVASISCYKLLSGSVALRLADWLLNISVTC